MHRWRLPRLQLQRRIVVRSPRGRLLGVPGAIAAAKRAALPLHPFWYRCVGWADSRASWLPHSSVAAHSLAQRCGRSTCSIAWWALPHLLLQVATSWALGHSVGAPRALAARIALALTARSRATAAAADWRAFARGRTTGLVPHLHNSISLEVGADPYPKSRCRETRLAPLRASHQELSGSALCAVHGACRRHPHARRSVWRHPGGVQHLPRLRGRPVPRR
jgi:hypothetical protein